MYQGLEPCKSTTTMGGNSWSTSYYTCVIRVGEAIGWIGNYHSVPIFYKKLNSFQDVEDTSFFQSQ